MDKLKMHSVNKIEENIDDGYAKGTICISLGKYNTKEEAEEIVAAFVKIVG